MKPPSALFLGCAFVLFSTFHPVKALAQAPAVQPAPPSAAASLLQQAVDASGGVQTLSALTKVTATGSVTYNWANTEVTGSALLNWTDTDGLTLESDTDEGRRILAATAFAGSLTDERGLVSSFGSHNASRTEFQYFPTVELAWVRNSRSAIVQVGPKTTIGGHLADIVMISGCWPTNGQDLADQTVIFYLDHSTHLVFRRDDYLEATPSSPGRLPREIDYSGYQQVNGVYLPTVISEILNQQSLSSFTFTHLTAQ